MDIKDVVCDPEFEGFLPPLSAEERASLRASIESNGITDPIVVWQHHGEIVDGYNRYRLWQELGSFPKRAPEIIERKFADRAAVLKWIFDRQAGRRNWTAAQKAAVALKMKPAIEERAKENEKQGGGDKKSQKPQDKSGLMNSSNPIRPVNTRKEIAKIAGVSEDTVRKAETVLNEGSQETKDAMLSGEKTLNQAYKETKGKPSAGMSFNPAEFDEGVAGTAEEKKESTAPPHLVKVLEGVAAYKSLQREVSLLFGKVEALAKEPIGSYIQLQEIEQHIKQVKADLKAYSYGDNCPLCKNKPDKKCERCKGRGWLAHSQMGRLSDYDKQWLEDHSVKP